MGRASIYFPQKKPSMANIRIEEMKKGGGILPWIIGLLLLGLIIWAVAAFIGGDDDEMMTEEETVEEYTPPAQTANNVDYATPVAAFMTLTNDMEGEMGLDHEFSHDALTRLAKASVALADNKGVEDEASADSKGDRVMQLADDITKDPTATDHADKIKKAAMLITEILEDVSEEGFDGKASASLAKLRSEVEAMTPQTLTLDQKENVRSFFAQARIVLQELS